MAIKKLILVLLLSVSFALNAFGATRLMFEECEDTEFIDFFLEGTHGTTYWAEFMSDVSRSSYAPYAGTYSKVYDPYTTNNPRGTTGLLFGEGEGNTQDIDYSATASRYWYIRWRQRWESGASYSGGNQKILYVGSAAADTLYGIIQKFNNTDFQVILYDTDDSSAVYNDYAEYSPGLDDEVWHKWEVFYDVGTTGGGNGSVWVKVNGVTVSSGTSITYNDQIGTNPMRNVSFASNVSGEWSGTQDIWHDAMEVWIVDGPGDIPSDGEDTTPPTVTSWTVGINGETITSIMSESVTVNNGAGWTATMTGGATTISYVSGSGTSILIFSSSRTIQDGETGTYDFPGGANYIEDAAGNDLVAIVDGTVVNDSNQGSTPPGAIGAVYNAAAPAVEYSAGAVGIVAP